MVTFYFFETEEPETFGQYGEVIGGLIGTIWSLAGVLLFYVALTDQKKDIRINQEALKNQIQALELQTDEFKLQRQELEETREVLKAQARTFRIQQFESTFFNMMKLFQEIIYELQIDFDGQKGEGRDFFKVAFSNLQNFVKQHNIYQHDQEKALERAIFLNAIMDKDESPTSPIVESDLKQFRDKIIDVYEDFYKYYHHNLGHYFRFLYNIFKFTINSDLSHEEKRQYINLIQAQMSSYELGLVFYNALSRHGNKLYNWLEDYTFLENIDPKALLIPWVHVQFYPKTKFKFVEMKNYGR